MSIAGRGLMGLREMFSLKAVERGRWLLGSVLDAWSKGSVSDLCMRFLICGIFVVSADIRREWECFLVEMGGEGRRVERKTADGSRE